MTTYLTPEQLAAIFPRRVAWIREQLRSGALEGSCVNGRWLTTEQALSDFLASNSNKVKPRAKRRLA